MNIKKILVGSAASALIFSTFIAPAFADSVSVNFEPSTYSVGNINGQDGWTSLGSAGLGCALYDQAVFAHALFPSFGQQSLRISDAVTSGFSKLTEVESANATPAFRMITARPVTIATERANVRIHAPLCLCIFSVLPSKYECKLV
jgi:hypothetical protein